MSSTVDVVQVKVPHRRRGGAIVRLTDLRKRFPVRRPWVETLRHPFQTEWTEVLRGVTCEVGEGEFFGLLGQNGAGKTTLFKILSTLVIPDGGHADVAGHDVVCNGRAVRRLLSPVIADERSLFWRLSARQNLELFASLQAVRGDAGRRIAEVLHTVELDDAAHRMVGTFSSGMKQRLLIARALLAGPRVLLLDEPTRSLDPVSAQRFREFLRDEISGRQGCTVLLATHNTEEALELCHRVAVLDRGRLLAVGTADGLARQAGEDRYRLRTSEPVHPEIGVLAAERRVHRPRLEPPDDAGWTVVDMEVPGGDAGAAAVVARLAAAGVPVASFERRPSSLAELIERVVQRFDEGSADA